MKAKYLGEDDFPYLTKGKTYEIIAVEKGPDFTGEAEETDWYRVNTDMDEDYLFLPDGFELIEE
ncbi:MAG: hypothetical protein E7488_05910 [Ruminococcaceae bacterium]|nr:hypothetical protein [Oscillospiraceae bacterium]